MDINSIVWKGISSDTITGLIIQELPPISKPPMRIQETVVDGRDGSIIEELGYSSYEKSISIGLYGNYDINAVISYFSGEGTLILSNESNYYYNAKIVSQIDFNRLVRFRTATVKFKVQPFKYNEQAQVTTTRGTVVTNSGNIMSKPVFTIIGSGEIEFKVDNITFFSYTFPENENTVTIDCENEETYNGSDLRNRNMVGEYVRLPVGNSTISIVGGTFTRMTITKHSRWL